MGGARDWITVVELPTFRRRIIKRLDMDLQDDLIAYLARHPESGTVIPETGGLRKLRWGRSGVGKRGGLRVIYYYHDDTMPLFLLSAYGKSEQSNISRSEKQTMKTLVKSLVETFSRRTGEEP